MPRKKTGIQNSFFRNVYTFHMLSERLCASAALDKHGIRKQLTNRPC